MDSVLNKTVSAFKDYFTTIRPQPVNLITWLTSDKYADKVAEIRAIDDSDKRKPLKKHLPAITPSGTFKIREAKSLIQHSGLLQFDIDFDDNTHIKNYKKLKQQIINISNVAYCGLSVSGRGYWGLVPIAQPDQHKRHFKALEQAFDSFGITIDPNCSDVCRLRGYSWDPDAYFNHDAKTFTALYTPPKPKPRKFKRNYDAEGTRKKVELLIDKISTDITAGPTNWAVIGYALADEFGESGRDYFHAVCSYHPDYDKQENDYQFSYCLRNSGKRANGATIATFFKKCAEHGYTFKEDLKRSNGKYKGSNTAQEAVNPFTGEVMPDGYPPDWADVALQDASVPEKQRSELIAMQDATPEEMQEIHFN